MVFMLRRFIIEVIFRRSMFTAQRLITMVITGLDCSMGTAYVINTGNIIAKIHCYSTIANNGANGIHANNISTVNDI